MITTILGGILSFFKNYWKEILIAIVVGIISLKIYNAGYDSGIKKYDDLIADIAKQTADAKVAVAEAKTEVLIKYKDRVIYKEKKSASVAGKINEGALNEESNRCVIGPEFIGLHNLSAKD